MILPKLLFRKISRDPGLMPRVPERWTVLVISRFRDLRLQILCQLETSVAEMPTVSSISAMCPNEWTTVIFSGFRDFRCGVSRPFVNKTSDIPNSKCRNDGTWIYCHLSSEMDGSQSSRDFAICDVGILRIGVLESSLSRSSNARSPILRLDQIDGSRSISIQWSRITRDFAIREFSRQSSDLYTL
jgi:hypothetical protein